MKKIIILGFVGALVLVGAGLLSQMLYRSFSPDSAYILGYNNRASEDNKSVMNFLKSCFDQNSAYIQYDYATSTQSGGMACSPTKR